MKETFPVVHHEPRGPGGIISFQEVWFFRNGLGLSIIKFEEGFGLRDYWVWEIMPITWKREEDGDFVWTVSDKQIWRESSYEKLFHYIEECELADARLLPK